MAGLHEPHSIARLAEAVSARPITGGRLCIELPTRRRWRLHVRLEAVVAALLLNAVLLLFVAQVVFAPESTAVPATARASSWVPLTLFGAAVLADLALYATLFTRRDPLDLWVDERGIGVRSGPEVVRFVAAAGNSPAHPRKRGMNRPNLFQ